MRENFKRGNLEYGARTEGFASPPSHPHFIIKSTLQSTGLAWNGGFSFHWLRALLETVTPAPRSKNRIFRDFSRFFVKMMKIEDFGARAR